MTNYYSMEIVKSSAVSDAYPHIKFCNIDYPLTIPIAGYSSVGTSWAAKTGVLTYPADQGKWKTKQYCDGGAVALGLSLLSAVSILIQM